MVKQYDKIRKIATGQGDDYTTGCLLGYQYFRDHYNLITIDLSRQKELLIQEQLKKLVFMGC